MTTDTLEAPPAARVQTLEPTLLSEVRAISLPDMAVETRRADTALRMATSFIIASQEDYVLAGEELQSIKTKINALEAKRQTVAGPLHKAWTAFNLLFKAPMDVLKDAEATVKHSMLAYSDEQDRIAAIAKKEADAIAASEKKRLEDEARAIETAAASERQRIADLEVARVTAANAEHERLERDAIAALASGDTAAIAAIEQQVGTLIENGDLAASQAREQSTQIDEAATSRSANLKMEAFVTSTPVVYVAPARAAGISKSVTYDYELQDMAKLIAHIATKPELSSLLCLDTVKTRAYVRSLGANTNLPGLRVFSKSTLSARAA